MEAKSKNDLTFKVSDKTRSVSVYFPGSRFPTTLYYQSWTALLAAADELHAFLEEAKVQGLVSLRKEPK